MNRSTDEDGADSNTWSKEHFTSGSGDSEASRCGQFCPSPSRPGGGWANVAANIHKFVDDEERLVVVGAHLNNNDNGHGA